MARFSVIIPVKNGERYIHRCLESILSQPYNDYEIIVILNGCSDDSLSILQRFADNDERIRIVSTDISGVSNARNLGLEIANGEIVTFVDIDDYLAPNYFESIDSSFSSHPNSDAVVFNLRKVDHSFPEVQSQLHEDHVITGKQAVELFFDGNSDIQGYCCNKAIRATRLNNARFNTELFMGEDLDFMSRLFYQFKEVVINPNCLYYYCINSESATGKTKFTRRNSRLMSISAHSENLIHCDYQLYRYFSIEEGPNGNVADVAFKTFSYFLIMFYFSAFTERNESVLRRYKTMVAEMMELFRKYYARKYKQKYIITFCFVLLTSSKLFYLPSKFISFFI